MDQKQLRGAKEYAEMGIPQEAQKCWTKMYANIRQCVEFMPTNRHLESCISFYTSVGEQCAQRFVEDLKPLLKKENN